MRKWLKAWLLRLIEWLLGEAAPALVAEIQQKRQLEVQRKARVGNKVYTRFFHFVHPDGKTSVMHATGDCDTITQFNDAWAQAVFPHVKLVHTIEKTEWR